MLDRDDEDREELPLLRDEVEREELERDEEEREEFEREEDDERPDVECERVPRRVDSSEVTARLPRSSLGDRIRREETLLQQ
ncbi:MAG: hypothetical protein RL114_923 [Actinomycetota bacterium]